MILCPYIFSRGRIKSRVGKLTNGQFPCPGFDAGGSAALDMDRWFPEDMKRARMGIEGRKKRESSMGGRIGCESTGTAATWANICTAWPWMTFLPPFTHWGSNLFIRFCEIFFHIFYCLLRQHTSCSSALKPVHINILQNLRNKLLPQTVEVCNTHWGHYATRIATRKCTPQRR